MGGMSYFIWKDVKCGEMGCRLRSPFPIIRPEERVEHDEIIGRSGDLTRTQGEDVYNSYIQTASITVEGWDNVRNVYNWLKGDGYLTTSSEPDRQQKARVIGAITLDRISKNMDKWTGEAQFYCQPLKELLSEPNVDLSASGTVRNRGDVTSRPLIRVRASAGTVVLTAGRAEGNANNSETITVTGISSGDLIWIDSESMEVLNGGKTQLLTNHASGDFPMLKPGDNTISGSGWSSVRITRRERYL